jgi:hypothetical protein
VLIIAASIPRPRCRTWLGFPGGGPPLLRALEVPLCGVLQRLASDVDAVAIPIPSLTGKAQALFVDRFQQLTVAFWILS